MSPAGVFHRLYLDGRFVLRIVRGPWALGTMTRVQARRCKGRAHLWSRNFFIDNALFFLRMRQYDPVRCDRRSSSCHLVMGVL